MTRLGAVAMVVVLVVGVLIAYSITKPLRGLVEASTQIAMGNLDTQVLVEGSDEISALSSSLNRLLDDLRQGRLQSGGLSSASPATPLNQLPSTTFQQEEGTGPLRITVTILHANTQGWTPPELGGKGEGDLQRLKYLYESVVPILVAHGGLISHFGLDGVQAIFGLHPRYAPPHISALQGVHAALEIQTGIRIGGWSSRMEKPEGFISGIGVATGSVQVVAIGKEPNSYVTPVGLPLEVARELQQVSLDMEGNPVLIGPETYRHLGSSRKRFAFGRTGEARIPNVPEVLRIYEVESREEALIEGADLQKTLELFQIEEMETEGDLPA